MAGYEYFGHFSRALETRYRRRGLQAQVSVVDMPPTSSIRLRAELLCRTLERVQLTPNLKLHLVGHSTGGLDIRLAAKASATPRAWRQQLCSALTINTPHQGTPLATYFTTAAGSQVLHALSLLSVVCLSRGDRPLSLAAGLLKSVGNLDQRLGSETRVFRRFTDSLLGHLSQEGRDAALKYLSEMRQDRGGLIQTTPEAMDLFNSAIADDARLRWGCVVTAAKPISARRFGRKLLSPLGVASASLFHTIHGITGKYQRHYTYAPISEALKSRLESALQVSVDSHTSDGVVPTLSMIHGELVWAGPADHLDIIGHFSDNLHPSAHDDWMPSSARFGRQQLSEMAEAAVKFQLAES